MWHLFFQNGRAGSPSPPCRGIPMARVGDGAFDRCLVWPGQGTRRCCRLWLVHSRSQSYTHVHRRSERTPDTHAHRTMSAPMHMRAGTRYTNNCFLSLMSTNMSHRPAHTCTLSTRVLRSTHCPHKRAHRSVVPVMPRLSWGLSWRGPHSLLARPFPEAAASSSGPEAQALAVEGSGWSWQH